MRNKELSVFSKTWAEEFIKNNSSKILEASKAVDEMSTNDFYIRNRDDSILSIASSKRNLNLYSKELEPGGGAVDIFKPFIEDYRIVPKEQRVKKMIVFDTETTGQYNSYVVSIAIVILNLETMEFEDEYYTLVNPLAEIEDEAYKVHKISQEEVNKAKTFEELYEEIGEFLKKGDILCGQNIETFDLRVLEREYERINVVNPLLDLPIFDTMFMAKHIVKAVDVKGRIKNPRVEETMEFFEIPEPDGAYHNALVDTKACGEIVKRLFSYQYPEED